MFSLISTYDVSRQTTDILSAKLAGTNKFILVERSDLELINKELSLGGLEKLNINADYLIIGSVTEFGRHCSSYCCLFQK